MNEFSVLMESLLDQCVTYLQHVVDLEGVSVRGDELTLSAEVEIVLGKDTWEQQVRAIDHMIDIREMFIDDVSISYSFTNADDWQHPRVSADDTHLVYAPA